MRFNKAFKEATAKFVKDLMVYDLDFVEAVINGFPEAVREEILKQIYEFAAKRCAARSRVPNESVRYIAPERSMKMRSEHRHVKVFISDEWKETDIGGALVGCWDARNVIFELHGTRHYNPASTYRLRVYDPTALLVNVKFI